MEFKTLEHVKKELLNNNDYKEYSDEMIDFYLLHNPLANKKHSDFMGDVMEYYLKNKPSDVLNSWIDWFNGSDMGQY